LNLSFKISTSNRLEGLDQLRGVAVLCVLISHFSIAINNGLIDIQNQTINVGTIGVLIFFCVSGYVIPWSMHVKEGVTSVYGFWVRRVFRLYPIYLIAAFLGMFVLGEGYIISMVKQKMLQDPVGYFLAFFSMTSHLSGRDTIFQGLEWTLAYEMIFYCACTVFLLLRKCLPVVFSLISTVIVVCLAVLLPDVFVKTNIIQKFFFFYLFFLAGLVLYLHNSGFIGGKLFKTLSATLVITMCVRSYLWYSYWGISYLTLAFIPAVYFFYSVLLGKIKIESKFLTLVGVVSYSIYLTHIFIPHNIPLETLPPLFRFIGWLLISVVVASLSYKFIEYPAIRASRKLAQFSFSKVTN
jgi:peptidoglycan/LPS O-acetylase OafA/YrhL